jgi:hypothetical protein
MRLLLLSVATLVFAAIHAHAERAIAAEVVKGPRPLCHPDATIVELQPQFRTPARAADVCKHLAQLAPAACAISCRSSSRQHGRLTAHLPAHISQGLASRVSVLQPLQHALRCVTPPAWLHRVQASHGTSSTAAPQPRTSRRLVNSEPTSELPQFTFVPGNYQLSDSLQKAPSWALDRVDQPKLPLDGEYAFPNTAPTVSNYVLSSGVRSAHSDFQPFTPRAGAAAPARGVSRVSDVYERLAGDASGDESYSDEGEDCNGLGTHEASVAAGLSSGAAKGAQVKAMRVLSCKAAASAAGLVHACEWLADKATQPAVALMAIGDITVTPAVQDAMQRCAPRCMRTPAGALSRVVCSSGAPCSGG